MRFLRSPRWRRRIAWTVAPIAVVVPLIYLGVHYSSPGNPENATGGKADIYREPKHVPFTPAKQRAVRKVLAQFIEHAVARHDSAKAWLLAGPSLREGTTYEDWQRGDIPVVPYPAAKHGQGTWSYVQFSYPNRVGLEVLMFPQPGSGYSMATADAEVAHGRDGRWRVDYWMINKFHGPPATAAVKNARTKAKAQARRKQAKHASQRARKTAAPAAPVGPKPVDRKWLILPFAVLSLIVLIPLGLGVGMWIRNRRAAAELKRAS